MHHQAHAPNRTASVGRGLRGRNGGRFWFAVTRPPDQLARLYSAMSSCRRHCGESWSSWTDPRDESTLDKRYYVN